MLNKNLLFTIGQFASMHKINKKTLMWYDEVELFKPAVIKENGYRYYTYNQSYTLEIILMFRELNISINEIKGFMEKPSAESLDILLREKTEELERTIAHLNDIKNTLVNQRNGISKLLNIDLSSITIVEREEKSLITIKTPKGTTMENEMELIVAETKKHQLQRLYDSTYGTMTSVENIYKGNFDDYTLFLHIPGLVTEKAMHKQPGGKYLLAYCKGNWDKLPQRYKEILSYAKENNIALYDFSYETGINEIVIDSKDNYITQIEIPIKEK